MRLAVLGDSSQCGAEGGGFGAEEQRVDVTDELGGLSSKRTAGASHCYAHRAGVRFVGAPSQQVTIFESADNLGGIIRSAPACSAISWVGGPCKCSSHPVAASTMNWVGVRPSGCRRVANSARQVSAAWCSQNPADSRDRIPARHDAADSNRRATSPSSAARS